MPPQPASVPNASRHSSTGSVPRNPANFLRKPSPSNPSGSMPARTSLCPCSIALYGLGAGVVAIGVAIDTATVVAFDPDTSTFAGLNVQVAPVGSPEQLSATAPLKPLSPVRLTCTLAVCPAFTLTLGTDALIEKSAAPTGAPGVIDPNRPPFSAFTPAAK